ncbi:3-deoxy-manno-octulosonate cytidylyltransferase [bacterium]|nr:3-deoxy-manno-octulosonate cytidylyltransferase [bacterium]
MKIIGVIPCRYQSSRFPGKSLALINGKPMMWHVYQRALESNILDEVYIATDDQRIVKVANEHNLKTVMTSNKHETGTDRVAEVASQIQADYYINIQGDEPFIEPEAIKLVAQAIIDCDNPLVQAANAYTSMQDISDVVDTNTVKVIMDVNQRALAYSRQPIPYPKANTAKYSKQLGLYAFKQSGLQVFSENLPASLEKVEGVEMYRLLEHGYSIQMVKTNDVSISVDTPSDLKRVQKKFVSA